jgi:hypothetical protein
MKLWKRISIGLFLKILLMKVMNPRVFTIVAIVIVIELGFIGIIIIITIITSTFIIFITMPSRCNILG